MNVGCLNVIYWLSYAPQDTRVLLLSISRFEMQFSGRMRRGDTFLFFSVVRFHTIDADSDVGDWILLYLPLKSRYDMQVVSSWNVESWTLNKAVKNTFFMNKKCWERRNNFHCSGICFSKESCRTRQERKALERVFSELIAGRIVQLAFGLLRRRIVPKFHLGRKCAQWTN